jgi:hypothetical protein
MIGVAPPSLGSNQPPVPGMGAAPRAPAAMPPAGQFGAPAPAAMPPGGTAPMATPPAAVSPQHAVNPLGGTVVADAGAFGGGFPGAGGAIPAPPAGAAGGYDIGAPPPGFGAPPPGFAQQPGAGYGAPPHADPAFGATAQSAPMVPAQHGAMAPIDEPLPPIPGTVGGANPIVTVLLIVLTCGIYGIYLLVKGKKSPVE